FEDRRYSFSEMKEQVDIAAKALIAEGVEHGDHVALWLTNSDDWVFLSFALARIGAVAVPLNTRFRNRDIGYVLNQSDSAFLITHDQSGPIDYLAMAKEVIQLPDTGDTINDLNFPKLRKVIILGEGSYRGTADWQTAKSAAAAITDHQLQERAARVDPDDPVFIMYTSGTTGHPKGVVHSHKIIRNVAERGYRLAITPDDIVLSYLPLFHAFGFSEGLMMTIVTGAKQIVTATFDPDECLDLIARERATMAHGFEAHLKALTEAQVAKPRDISSLRTGIFAAGMLSATPISRRGMEVMAPMRPISGYGMTEIWLGAGIGALNDSDQLRAESSGYPGLGYEVRIVDPATKQDCAVGEPGELIARGFSVMLGYYNKPEETARCFDEDGWFYTGDTGIWLEGGYFRLLGRYKDMLKVGGENVDPMETEGLLLEQPEVHEVAVVGLPDERLSEVPVAFVKLADGAEINTEGIIDRCRGAVASFKVPKHVIFLEEFPMTASGKIRKAELRERAKQELL
ncbi:MAG: AMP-binding protein, partial [Pseudomonadota bacterium]